MSEYCEICGEELKDKDNAAAITTGTIQERYDGFMADDGPWLMVICVPCLQKVQNKIKELLKL